MRSKLFKPEQVKDCAAFNAPLAQFQENIGGFCARSRVIKNARSHCFFPIDFHLLIMRSIESGFTMVALSTDKAFQVSSPYAGVHLSRGLSICCVCRVFPVRGGSPW